MSDFKLIESKWQKYWAKHPEIYRPNDPITNNQETNNKQLPITKKQTKKKIYILNEFPYPSGSGLHVGHAFSFVGGDVYARYKRMQGDNVLFPMGWDAFGLPTENYAIKMKRKPQEVTRENTDMFRNQMKRLAFSYDWDREINTTDPVYYKWTQWIFIQLFKKGLAYKKEMPINWCPSCKIGLANEEVVDSKCERCGAQVSRRNLSQWIVRITEYADKLIEGLKETNFIDKVRQSQINWIGKSEGARVRFKLSPDSISILSSSHHRKIHSEACGRKIDISSAFNLEVFTTRPDTLFGATFMVVAPEHELVRKLISEVVISKTKKEEIENYVKNTKKKSEMERTEISTDKTGVFSGLYAINPVNDKQIPIWISDFVLASYGTGAIMSVPAHDERDNEFAKKFGLEIIPVIEPITGKESDKEEFRQSIVALVRNSKNGKFLSINWGKFGGNLFVGGGIEKGEDLVETAKREIIEETGYKNVKLLEISEKIHHHYFAASKNVYRNIEATGLFFELESEEKQEVNLEENEKGKFKVEWITDKEAVSRVTDELHKYVFNRFVKGLIFSGRGIMANSGEFNGLDSDQAKEKMIKWLEEKGIGEKTASYHLRDWIFSRQHYWGEPIPMIFCEYCAKNHNNQETITNNQIQKYAKENSIEVEVLENNPGWYPVEEKQLPIVLPEVEAYEPTDDGKSPLSKIESFVKCSCPVCGEEATRETDTMPNWAGSDWYYLAYCMATKINNQLPITKKQTITNNQETNNNKNEANDVFCDIFSDSHNELKYWGPVDVYIGGDEHNVLHLLYSRFIYQFLWDLGVLPKEIKEPYYKRISHGVILGPDGQRMSKSKGNVIVPEVVADKYGVDVVRMYLMFMGPFDSTMAWNENTLMGVKRFLDKFFKFINNQSPITNNQNKSSVASSKEVKVIINKLIDTVSKDLENFKYNTAIAKMMESLNSLSAIQPISLSDEDIKTLIKLIAPMAPYTAEELWALFHPVEVSEEYTSVHVSQWPVVDKKYLIEETVTIAVAINGKVRDQLIINNEELKIKEEVIKKAKELDKVKKWIGDSQIVKEIYVEGKMINLVIQ